MTKVIADEIRVDYVLNKSDGSDCFFKLHFSNWKPTNYLLVISVNDAYLD